MAFVTDPNPIPTGPPELTTLEPDNNTLDPDPHAMTFLGMWNISVSITTSVHTTVFDTKPSVTLGVSSSAEREMFNDTFLDLHPHTTTFLGMSSEPVSKIQPSVHSTVLKE